MIKFKSLAERNIFVTQFISNSHKWSSVYLFLKNEATFCDIMNKNHVHLCYGGVFRTFLSNYDEAFLQK